MASRQNNPASIRATMAPVGAALMVIGLVLMLIGWLAITARAANCCACSQCYTLLVAGPNADAFHRFPAGMIRAAGGFSLALGLWLALPQAGTRLWNLTAKQLRSLTNRPIDPLRCQFCNYDLTGLPLNSPCPECGHEAS